MVGAAGTNGLLKGCGGGSVPQPGAAAGILGHGAVG
jgi:hypothetical protein